MEGITLPNIKAYYISTFGRQTYRSMDQKQELRKTHMQIYQLTADRGAKNISINGAGPIGHQQTKKE